VAAAEVWALQREGDATCRLSCNPSFAPYAHALAPLVRPQTIDEPRKHVLVQWIGIAENLSAT